MHPIFGQSRRLLAYLGGALVVGLFLTAALARQGLDWRDAAALVLPATIIYAFACLSALYVCLAAPLRTSSISRVLTTSGLAATLAAVVWIAILRGWSAVLNRFTVTSFSAEQYGAQAAFLFTAGVLLFLLSLTVHYTLMAFDAVREAERRQLQAEVLARDAQLSALRAQLDPHFLYNSLNSINALTTTDPAGARRMCLMLGDFLRQTLRVGSSQWIPLADELALADRFLDIEQVRFGDRLRVERQTDVAAGVCRVPPLLLQPLVENAVTHGIAQSLDGGTIRIEVQRHDSTVSIAIENPYDAEARSARAGLGLRNVRQRIAALFGEGARLNTAANGPSFRVELSLPCSSDD
jgi:sensor histidine kinase YesM